MSHIVLYVIIAGVVALIVTRLIHLGWHLHGQWRIRKAGPRLLMATRHRIWKEPAFAESTDLRYGPGGPEYVPQPPFRFVEELQTGSQPCVAVRDGRDRLWRVKCGQEARPEAFAVRIVAALGYFGEVTHFVPAGRIDGVGDLGRARSCIAPDGSFADARFELEDRSVRMLFDEHSWAWDDNPFVGSRQLAGLKILNMLLSNWDTKDRRDVSRGSNTAIFEHRVSGWSLEARYLISDWGGAMGKWGTNVMSRGRWDPEGFEAQTASFVTGVKDGWVNFGYQGQRTLEITRGISVDDVVWFFGYARRLTLASLRTGLLTSGATEEEATRFASAIITRIAQLGAACGQLRQAS